MFPVETGQDDYIKEICSTEGLIFNPARLQIDCLALQLHYNQKERNQEYVHYFFLITRIISQKLQSLLAYFQTFLSFCVFYFFPRFSNNWVSPYCGIGATIHIGREMLCLPYAGFLKKFLANPEQGYTEKSQSVRFELVLLFSSFFLPLSYLSSWIVLYYLYY